MPYYKDGNNKIHFLDSSDFIHLLPESYIEITEDEAKIIIKNSIPAITADEIRSMRDDKLTACDWTQGKDISDDISKSWQVYRQDLRDLTKQSGFPNTIIWPISPEKN